MTTATYPIDMRQSGRSGFIKLLAARIVAEWVAEQSALEQNIEAPQNATHDDAHSPHACSELLPL